MAVAVGGEYRHIPSEEEAFRHPPEEELKGEGIAKKCGICLEEDREEILRHGHKHTDLICADCFKKHVQSTSYQNDVRCPFCREVVLVTDDARRELGLPARPVRPSLLRRIGIAAAEALVLAGLLALGLKVSIYILLAVGLFFIFLILKYGGILR